MGQRRSHFQVYTHKDFLLMHEGILMQRGRSLFLESMWLNAQILSHRPGGKPRFGCHLDPVSHLDRAEIVTMPRDETLRKKSKDVFQRLLAGKSVHFYLLERIER
jgi:hypothetical protein